MSETHSNSCAPAVKGEMQLIAATVYDPTQPSIFGKGKKSDRAEFRQILCNCESCPLRAKKQCVQVAILGGRCPHGKFFTETGPTQRAASYRGWVSERNKIAKEHGWMSYATKKLTFIGDYVYLPYSHMDMCKAVPFLAHSAVITSGWQFIKREDWTIENVLKLIDFRPEAMFGGVIPSYQQTEVPLFVSHIRECDPGMWAQLIAAIPDLDIEPNYVGRKALLCTLAYPISIPPHDKRYPVAWEWNGKTATTRNVDAYSGTWGHIKAESSEISIVPRKDAEIVVQDNSWVTADTVFVD